MLLLSQVGASKEPKTSGKAKMARGKTSFVWNVILACSSHQNFPSALLLIKPWLLLTERENELIPHREAIHPKRRCSLRGKKLRKGSIVSEVKFRPIKMFKGGQQEQRVSLASPPQEATRVKHLICKPALPEAPNRKRLQPPPHPILAKQMPPKYVIKRWSAWHTNPSE